MKRVFFDVIMSFIVMFAIWVIVGYATIPNFTENITHYHLDLYAMINRFNFGSSANKNFINIFHSFIESMKKINTTNPLVSSMLKTFNKGGYELSNAFVIVLTAINALISPFISLINSFVVLGYLIVLIIEFLEITTILATALFDFVFSPVFIYV